MDDSKTMQISIKELADIAESLKKVSEIKAELTQDLEATKAVLGECGALLNEFKNISNEIKNAGDILERYSQRIESINKEFDRSLEEAKQIENRIMLEKMDLLITKAERIAHPSTIQENRQSARNGRNETVKEQNLNSSPREVRKKSNKSVEKERAEEVKEQPESDN